MWIYVLIFILIICIALILVRYFEHIFTGGFLDELPFPVLYATMEELPPNEFFNVMRTNSKVYEKLQQGRVEGYDLWEKKRQEQDQIKKVSNVSRGIQFIKNPSRFVQIAAVKYDPDNIIDIENPTEEVQDYIMNRYGWRLAGRIKNLNRKHHKQAVQLDPRNAEGIKNLSVELQMYLVNNTSNNLEYIQNPDETVQIAAVSKWISAIQYIPNPSKAVQLAAAKYDGSMTLEYLSSKGIVPDREVQEAAVKQNAGAIRFITNPDKDLQLLAVNTWGIVLEYIKNPSREVQLAAVNNDGMAIAWIDAPTEEMQKIAVQKDPATINILVNKSIRLSEAVQLAAVEKNPDSLFEITKAGIKPSDAVVIKYIEESGGVNLLYKNKIQLTEGAQLHIINNAPHLIGSMFKKGNLVPSEAAQLAAVEKNPDSLFEITKAGIKPSDAVVIKYIEESGGAMNLLYKNKIQLTEGVQLHIINKYPSLIGSMFKKGNLVPSEAAQLAAVEKNPDLYDVIVAAGITPSERVRQAAKK